jgi:hypothetical protein
MSYSKLHSSVVNSSLWTEPDHVRLLFITLLALCDREGFVYGSRAGLERAANITWFHDAADDLDPWDRLMSPDPDSSDALRAPENEGLRIEEVPGGFRLLNFEYYRGLRNDDDRREQNRQAQRRFKAKNKPESAGVSQDKPRSAVLSRSKPISEADTEADPKKKQSTEHSVVRRPTPPDPRVKEFLVWFQAEYTRKRQGATYLVDWARDSAIVKTLLTACDLPRLKQCAQILLSERTDDPFIVDTDRGIGILKVKFNWLSDRLAAWEARHERQEARQ